MLPPSQIFFIISFCMPNCNCLNMEHTIVLYPSAGISHIVPMVELGKRILTHHPYFSVTVIIPPPPFEDASIASYIHTVSATTCSISFVRLPSIPLPPDAPKDQSTLYYEFFGLNNPNLRQALLALSESSKLIKAFLTDFFCNAASQVTASLNIPTYYFLPGGANGLTVFLYSPTLHKHYTASFKDLDEFIHVPGLPPMPAYQMPTLLLDRDSKVYRYFIDTATQMAKSAGVIINTFESLEHKAVKAILDGQCTPGQSPPPLYCLGPLIVGATTSETQSVEERHACLSWLDSQPSRSIVFLNFGSMGKFSAKQLKEIAIGLESSGVRFLWVVRPPPPDPPQCTLEPESDESMLESFLPDGFLERTKERGMVVWSWAPQVQILNHDSIGGFLTHCGWNSVQEAICAGVPMLGWPLFADNKVHRAFLVEEVKVALSVGESRDGSVSGAELKERLIELMDSEHGKEIRERVMKMRDHALATWKENGPSLVALAKFAQSFNHI